MTKLPSVWGGKQPDASLLFLSFLPPGVDPSGTDCKTLHLRAAGQASRACLLGSALGAVLPADAPEPTRVLQPLTPEPTPSASGGRTLPGNLV